MNLGNFWLTLKLSYYRSTKNVNIEVYLGQEIIVNIDGVIDNYLIIF